MFRIKRPGLRFQLYKDTRERGSTLSQTLKAYLKTQLHEPFKVRIKGQSSVAKKSSLYIWVF